MQSTTTPQFNGIKNEGATCYMNSLLQTLFMTPEFRSQLYSYRFSESKLQLIDSIPYQLQRLFLNLQYSQDVCSTRKLIKSFQWEDAQKFEQHDVQQFCRVLFDAIQNSSDKQWIQKNYSGLMKSYVRCENGHSSERLEHFMDLSLTIKNPFQNVENHSIEEAIKGYLKPEKLEYGNKYLCDQCGEKVNATKGLEFMTLPKILTIQLKRFELNFETMQRQKINEFVYFPQILEMERFFKQYEHIEINQIPKELQELRSQPLNDETKKKLEEEKNKKTEKFQKAPLKRKNSQQKIRTLEQVSFLDDILVGKQKKEVLTAEEQKLKNIQTLRNLKFNKDQLDKKVQNAQNKLNKEQKAAPTPKPTLEDLEDDILFGIGGAMIAQSTNWEDSKITVKGAKGTSSFSYSHQEPTYNPQEKYPPNTYALFAVLVHDGNAYHGHYYAYIRYGDDWYKFDDSRVTKVNELQVRKYGDLFKFSQGANAYMLFYRNVNTIKQLKDVEAAPELIENLNDPAEKEQDKKIEASQRRKYTPYEMRTLQKPFKIKLYYPKPIFTTLQDVALSMTVEELRSIIRQQFKIEEQDKNWRLRSYNSFQGTLLTPIEDPSKTLQQYNLRETVSMTIEFKKSQEVFEQFDPHKIALNINIWKPGFFYQKDVQPLQIKIRDDQLFSTLIEVIRQKTHLLNPRVIKRSFVKGNNVAQVIQPNANSTLLGLRFFNNLTIYVDDQKEKTKWHEEFDSQKYRVSIKYNDPQSQVVNTILYDNRKPFKDLKAYLGELINMPVNEFRVKSSEDSPELSGKKRLSDLRIIGETSLFLELGKSIKDIISISKCKAFNTETGIGYDKQPEEHYEIEVTKTVEELKKEIATKNNLQVENVRIREFKRTLGEIFKNDAVLSKIKDRVLVWEEVEDEFRGIQIYTRLFKDGVLEEFNEIFAEYDATYQELALIIAQNYQIEVEATEGFSSMKTFETLQYLSEVQWFNVNSQDGKLSQPPFYINIDGVYLIVRLGDKKVFKPKSKAVKEMFTYGKGAPGKNQKEKALKITVKKKEEKEVTQSKQTAEQKADEVAQPSEQ